MESFNLLKSSSDALTIARSPDIASCPARDVAICVCSAFDRPLNPLRRSDITVSRDFTFPTESVNDRPNVFIAVCTSFVGFVSLLNICLREVPASPALIPEFAINPMATPQSSTLNPNAPATGATYLNVSPIMETFVFALDDAAARTSAKCVESCADNPNAVNASVTISEVVARFSPEAAAKFMIPSIPLSMSAVFQPAIAMYSIACADSVAENLVLAPISFALSVRDDNSSPVAPDMADTFDISASNVIPTLMAAVPISPTFPATLVIALPTATPKPVVAILLILLMPSLKPFSFILVSKFKYPSAILSSFLIARLNGSHVLLNLNIYFSFTFPAVQIHSTTFGCILVNQ